jgi:hypothetical protein
MPRRPIWGTSPRESIAAECARRGKDAVVAGCIELVRGEQSDPDLLRALAGPGVEKFYDGAEHEDDYWLRVWGLRGLLWSWDPRAAGTVCAAMADEHWRVREMAAKVAARHLVDEATTALADLRDDSVPRVRAAAERALVRLARADA